jgi:hypothetical protein
MSIHLVDSTTGNHVGEYLTEQVSSARCLGQEANDATASPMSDFFTVPAGADSLLSNPRGLCGTGSPQSSRLPRELHGLA